MICYLFYNCLILRIFTTFPKDVGGGVVNTKFLLNDVNFSGLGGAKIWYIFSKMRLRHTQNYVVLTYITGTVLCMYYATITDMQML